MADITGDSLLPEGFLNQLDQAAAKAGVLDTRMEELANTLRNEVNKGFESLRTELKSVGLGSAQAATKLAQLEARIIGLKRNSKEYEKELKSLRKANGDISKQLTELRTKYDSLSTSQDKVVATTGRTSNAVGGLIQRYAGLTAGLILVERSMRTIQQQVIAAVESNITLEQAMKEVEAISRATSAQMKSLTADADRLGATTEKTAQEVAGLQKELAKLGFNPSEIIASADAIIDLSTATGEDLVKSATVGAATLRAFGLEATEMNRVVDVMSGSFVRSGLDLEKFRESMKLVAPIARAANIEIEVTTAALSKLADAGLSGSLAGTALRNLMSEMADPTSELAQRLGYVVESSDDLIKAFKQLKAEGVTLAEAVQMVDVRARPAFFTIMNNVEAVDALNKEYKSLSGEGQRIATLMRDTLANDIEIAQSSFDAMRRGLVEGWTPAIREATQELTLLSEGIRLYNSGAIETSETAKAAMYTTNAWWESFKNSVVFIRLGEWALLGYQKMWESTKKTIQDAQVAEEIKRIADEVAGSMEAVKTASSYVTDFRPLIDEFRALENATNKTAEQMTRMEVITNIFQREFGMTAVMVNRETQAIQLNTAELERQINAKEKESKTILATNTNRVNEIKSRLEILKVETQQLANGKQASDILTRYSEIQKEVIALQSELVLKAPFLELANGWSILTAEGRKYAEMQQEILNVTKEAAKEQFDYAVAVAKLEEQRAKHAFDNAQDEITRIDLAEKHMKARLRLLEVEIESERARLAEGEESADKRRALEVKSVMQREAILNDYYNTIKGEEKKLLDLAKQNQEEYVKSVEETGKRILERVKEQNAQRAEAEKALQSELARLQKLNNDEYQKQAASISQISADRVIADYQSTIRYTRMTLTAQKAMHQGIIDAHRRRAEEGQLLTEQEAESLKNSLQELGDISQEQARRIYEAFSVTFQGVSAIVQEVAQNAAAIRRNELAEVERTEQIKTELAGDNTELRIRAEYEAAEARKRIMREEAQAEKDMALFNIAINTAQGIMAALAKANPILAGVIAATGAIQASIVSARELPAYEKGTDSAKGGPSIVGEKGTELVQDKKTGKMFLTPDTATVVNLSKGSVVKTADETKKILQSMENGDDNRRIAGTLRGIETSIVQAATLDQGKLEQAFAKAVQKIPVTTYSQDRRGYTMFEKRQASVRKILNKKHGIR